MLAIHPSSMHSKPDIPQQPVPTVPQPRDPGTTPPPEVPKQPAMPEIIRPDTRPEIKEQ